MENKIHQDKDMFIKIALGIIVLLLVINTVFMFFPNQSWECQRACQAAEDLIGADISIFSKYEDIVYDSRIRTIDEQIFLANEFQFLSLEKIMLYQIALINVMVSCQ